jgi:hypothetical protein
MYLDFSICDIFGLDFPIIVDLKRLDALNLRAVDVPRNLAIPAEFGVGSYLRYS